MRKGFLYAYIHHRPARHRRCLGKAGGARIAHRENNKIGLFRHHFEFHLRVLRALCGEKSNQTIGKKKGMRA